MSTNTTEVDLRIPRFRSSPMMLIVPPRFFAVVIKKHENNKHVLVEQWLGIKFYHTKSAALQKIKRYPYKLFDFNLPYESMLVADTFTFDKKIEYEVRHEMAGQINWPEQVKALKEQWDTYVVKANLELDTVRTALKKNIKLIDQKIEIAKTMGENGAAALLKLQTTRLRRKHCLRNFKKRQSDQRRDWLSVRYKAVRHEINEFFRKCQK